MEAGAQCVFALSADDFGLTAGVSRGILALAERGRLSATGVMTNRPAWRDFAPALRQLEGRLAIGLHLNLTLGAPLTPLRTLTAGGTLPGVGDLVKSALARQLPAADIAQEIEAQLEAFVETLGRPPDFIDGHQHVHALFGVRRILLMTLGRLGLAGRLWLRDPADRVRAILRRRTAAPKAIAIAALAAGFGAEARRAGFATNEGFAGVSPFVPGRDYAADFERFLIDAGPRHLVMCHPGGLDRELVGLDPVVATRPEELAFLLSERFAEVCAAANARLLPGSVLIERGTTGKAWGQ